MASVLAIHRTDPVIPEPSPLTGDSYRVVIRMETVRQNLTRQLGQRPTDSDVLSWLGTLGFTPATDGNAWTCDQDSLRWLEEEEIVRTEPVDQDLLEFCAASRTGTMQKLRGHFRGLSGRVHAAVDRFTRTLSAS